MSELAQELRTRWPEVEREQYAAAFLLSTVDTFSALVSGSRPLLRQHHTEYSMPAAGAAAGGSQPLQAAPTAPASSLPPSRSGIHSHELDALQAVNALLTTIGASLALNQELRSAVKHITTRHPKLWIRVSHSIANLHSRIHTVCTTADHDARAWRTLWTTALQCLPGVVKVGSADVQGHCLPLSTEVYAPALPTWVLTFAEFGHTMQPGLLKLRAPQYLPAVHCRPP
jgi:hypothetical protein